jgi:flagellar motility protein MotE (MotC chaperone)
MTQLWSAHDLLLQAALQDRLVLQQQCTAAVAAIAAAAQEQQRLRQLAEDERVALRAINERHAARADAARQDYEQLKLQNDNVSSRDIMCSRALTVVCVQSPC